jgi:hypothetical protein
MLAAWLKKLRDLAGVTSQPWGRNESSTQWSRRAMGPYAVGMAAGG